MDSHDVLLKPLSDSDIGVLILKSPGSKKIHVDISLCYYYYFITVVCDHDATHIYLFASPFVV